MTCEKCKCKLKLPKSLHGKKVECPYCEHIMIAPVKDRFSDFMMTFFIEAMKAREENLDKEFDK